jgi:hypothetical protein
MSSPDSKLAKQWSSLWSIAKVAEGDAGKPVTQVLNSLAMLRRKGTWRLAVRSQRDAPIPDTSE